MKYNSRINRVMVVVFGAATLIGAIMIQPVGAANLFPHIIEGDRGIIQEALGKAIVDAERAEAVQDKAVAQEVVGHLIVTAALLDLQQNPSAIPVEAESITYLETQGEVVFWVAAALLGVLYLYFIFGLEIEMEASMPVKRRPRTVFPVDINKTAPLAHAA